MITKFGSGTLFGGIHDYLKVYLPKQRNLSIHTQNSYRQSLDQLVDFIKTQKGIPIEDVTFEMLTAETITAFLDFFETDCGNGISSRNTRLAAIRAFLKYAANRNIVNVAILQEAKRVVVKKPNKAEAIEYMSMDAVSAIVEQIDISSHLGLRDRTMLILLYDSGARVQELVSIKLKDIRFGKNPTVTVLGKRKKIRTIPIMERTVEYLKKYLLEFHSGVPSVSEAPLFYSTMHGEQHPITDRRVRYLVKEYAMRARQTCIEVPPDVHPHMFRHSRAMHLYQNGMDLTLVSQWLGHANLEVTQVYAHADTEHKRTAIAKATPVNSVLFSKLNPERYTVTDEDVLKKLIGLKK